MPKPRRRSSNKLSIATPEEPCPSHHTEERYSANHTQDNYPTEAHNMDNSMDYDKSTPTSTPTSPLSGIDDEYLNSILNNYGIRMGLGGEGVVEVEDIHNPYDDRVAHITDLSGASALAVTSSCPASPGDLQDDYSAWGSCTSPGSTCMSPVSSCMSPGISSTYEDPPSVQSQGGSILDDNAVRKPRKYKLSGPLNDPEEEKRRRNAVIARENRLKHKKYLDDIQNKKRSLEHVNAQCAKALVRVRQDIKAKDQHLHEANQQIRELRSHIKAKSEQVSNYKSQLTLIRTHLELIEASVDSSNPVRGFITTLLQRLPQIDDNSQNPAASPNVPAAPSVACRTRSRAQQVLLLPTASPSPASGPVHIRPRRHVAPYSIPPRRASASASIQPQLLPPASLNNISTSPTEDPSSGSQN